MKILFIAPANSIHTVRWVNALTEKENKVVLVSLPNHRTQVDTICKTVKIIYLKFGGAMGYYLNAPYLSWLHKRFSSDIIHVHYASGYGTLARIARLPNILLSVWGSDVYEFPYENKWKMSIIQKNLLYAGKIASTSHAMAKQVQRLIGKIEIAVTPFGVNTDKFKKTKRVDNNCFTIGVVKALSPVYGIDIVIHAFHAFTELSGIKETRLLIYGIGPDKEKLMRLCKKLQILEKVTFVGYIANKDVAEALNKLDIVCMGSRKESFGVSAIEAMACEIPVIATITDGFSETLKDGVTGFLVPQNNYKAMAEKILYLYNNDLLRKKMGIEGRKRVLELYDWEENVKAMIRLYKTFDTVK